MRRAAHIGFRLTDQARLTLLLFLFSFFVTGMPRVFTSTATHTILLEHHGAGALPVAYILQALLVPLGGYFFVLLEGKLRLRTLILGTLVVDLLVLAALWAAYQVPGLAWVAYAGIIWFEVEFALVSLMLWGLANQLMTLRQGKRLFSIVGSGEPTAVILGGLATPLLLAWLKPADLLLMSGIGVTIGLGLTGFILARYTPQREQEGEGDAAEENTSSISGWWRSSYIRILVSVVFVSQLVYFFTDFAFYERANARFTNEQELAAFLGVIHAVVGVVSLITGLFLSAPLVNRFGLRTSLLVLPLLLASTYLAVVFTGHAIGTGELLFWLVVGAKVIDQSLRYTLDKTSSVTLFQPLPARQRNGVQAAMEGIVEPLSGGVAGVVLYVMAQWAGFTAFGIGHAILVAALVWGGYILVQHKGYLLALRQALAKRGLGGIDLAASDDEESLRVLRQGIESPRLGEALYCVDLLAKRGKLDAALLPIILSHPLPEVRKAGLDRVEADGLSATAPLVFHVLDAETDPRVLGAALRAYAATGADDAVEVVAPFLASGLPQIRLDAFAGLMRHGGIEGILAAGGPFLALIGSEDPEDRIVAAQIIRYTALSQFRRPLAQLLADHDPRVKVAALQAAAKAGCPELWPVLLEALEVPGCEQAATVALAAGGRAALPTIDAYLEFGAAPVEARSHAVAAMGLIGGEEAGQRLAHRLQRADRVLRKAMLRAINRCQYHCPPADRADGMNLLAEEVEHAVLLAASHADLEALDNEAAVGLLRQSLVSEIEQRLEGVAHLLGYLSPGGGIDSAWSVMRFGSETERAYLIEAIENLLPKALKPAVLALMEPDPVIRQAGLLLAQPQPRLPALERLKDMAQLSPQVVTPMIRAAALYAYVLKAGAERHWLHGLPKDDSPIVRELRDWAAARIDAVTTKA